MSVPNKPQTTRLRYVETKDKDKLIEFCLHIEKRIQIYEIVFAQGKWVMWFVPGDLSDDIRSGTLDA
jgi:hypothetical protein